MNAAADMEKFEREYRALIDELHSVSLATRAENGHADISYAPYLYREGVFYLYVSDLAKHTGNMLRCGQASLMLIEAESKAANPFARRRLLFDCQVAEINRNAADYVPLLAALQEKFGDIVGVLRSLSDFHLLALTPQQGQYVAGFGQAFEVDVNSGRLLPKAQK